MMKPLKQALVSECELYTFKKIQMIVQNLPDLDLGMHEDGTEILQSCAILSRALSSVLGLKYISGRFAHVYEHSWLVLPSGHIIDVYPVGMIGGPLLVVAEGACSPAKMLYEKKEGNYFDRTIRRKIKDGIHLKNAVRITADAVESLARKIC